MTLPPELVTVKLLLLADVVVLITGEATLGSNIMPSVVPLTTNFFPGEVVPMPTLPCCFISLLCSLCTYTPLVTVPILPVYLFTRGALKLIIIIFWSIEILINIQLFYYN